MSSEQEPYSLQATSAAARDYKRLKKILAAVVFNRIDQKISRLAANPRPPGYEPVVGSNSGILRVREGDYRILYVVDDESRIVTIAAIRNRRDAYKS